MMLFAVIGTAISANAVPSGNYTDNRSNRILITDWQNVYRLDSDGYVKSRYKIIKENPDGSFVLALMDEHDNVIEGLGHTSNNAWWTENGNIYLNLSFCPRTLVHE